MNQDKWQQIVTEEASKAADKHTEILSPSNWAVYKKSLQEYIEAVDEVTEVYNMENKGK